MRVHDDVSHLSHKVLRQHVLVDARGVVVGEHISGVLACHVDNWPNATWVSRDEPSDVIRAVVQYNPAVLLRVVLCHLGHGELRQLAVRKLGLGHPRVRGDKLGHAKSSR